MNPAIVIPCYRRAGSLRRLLASLSSAVYPDDGGVPLVLSVDESDDASVIELIDSFIWGHGEKKIIRHESHLGLKSHILYCGDLTEQYGAVVVLEDDLLVSPHFYDYAIRILRAYEADDRIAGVSLYCQSFNETAWRPFRAIEDGGDVFFLQLASSWGEAWTERQWRGFRAWLDSDDALSESNDDLPQNIRSWSAQSWKKLFNRYLVRQGKYFVYPRRSLTTNFSEAGEHVSGQSLIFQVPLLMGSKRQEAFIGLDESGAIYDAYHEIKPSCLIKYNQSLSRYDFAVDLYSSKDLARIDTRYVLTTRSNIGRTVMGYSADLLPHDANVALSVEGRGIVLCDTESLRSQWTGRSLRVIYECIHDYPFLGWRRSLYYTSYLIVTGCMRTVRSSVKRLSCISRKRARH